ncbi:hypothetical protein [Denitromonas iodatirespirans]|uniref:Uncharacterized protein n=1 Tax=Denitromonas iodatirespirans TaxID=2795389 RepID=A0A944D8C8_DENI1|nr:hypothetical protein [Denitromonas iodatirespirans]MBT0960216.1 hypothetical protein [Denitromonas iodatirespirans]
MNGPLDDCDRGSGAFPPQGIDPALVLEVFGQSPIVFHRIYVDVTGDILAALWLSYAVYYLNEYPEAAEAGWLARSQDDWHADTGMSRREQERARRRLRELGLIQERRRPNASMQFQVDYERLYDLLDAAAKLTADRPEGRG